MEAKRIELCVPAERSTLLIIRMTTAGVMSRAGLTLDEMDDMKMGVDEACNLLLLQKPGCQSLSVCYEYDENSVSVLVEGEGAGEATDEKRDMNMQEVIRCILESIADEVSLTSREDGGMKAIRLKKNIMNCRRSAV